MGKLFSLVRMDLKRSNWICVFCLSAARPSMMESPPLMMNSGLCFRRWMWLSASAIPFSGIWPGCTWISVIWAKRTDLLRAGAADNSMGRAAAPAKTVTFCKKERRSMFVFFNALKISFFQQRIIYDPFHHFFFQIFTDGHLVLLNVQYISFNRIDLVNGNDV